MTIDFCFNVNNEELSNYCGVLMKYGELKNSVGFKQDLFCFGNIVCLVFMNHHHQHRDP